MRPGPHVLLKVSKNVLVYFALFMLCFIFEAVFASAAQADTESPCERSRDLPRTGADEPRGSFEQVFPAYPDSASGKHGKLIALNGSDEPGASLAPDSPAEPEQMTFGAWLWDYLYNGASITVGIGTRQAELKVTRKSDLIYGKIVQRDEGAYFLSYSTRESFIGSSQFGYTFMLNYTTFNMDKQEVDTDVFEDLGTRVRGKTAYVVPTLFYQWGEHRKIGKFVRTGIGIGLGVAKFEGNIILGAPTNPSVPISNGSYNLKAAVSVYIEARYRHWGIKISVAGPTYQDKTYIYDLRDIAVNLGYSYYF